MSVDLSLAIKVKEAREIDRSSGSRRVVCFVLLCFAFALRCNKLSMITWEEERVNRGKN